MTRETKIGLLIGLGFIVVFAVVLSHTGSVLPAGGDMALAKRGPEGTGTSSLTGLTLPQSQGGLPDSRSPLGESPSKSDSTPRPAVSDRPRSPLPRNESRVGLSPLAEGLPMPSVLGPGPGALPGNLGASTSGVGGIAASAEERPMTLVERRVAPSSPIRLPELDRPEPSKPAALPTVSPAPESKPQPTSPSVPPSRGPSTKDYIVQKGDTLGAIVKASYGTASMKVVEFVATANRDNGVKDVHSVREGQKLVLPPLPPEFAAVLEPAGNIDVSHVTGAVRTAATDDMSTALRSGQKEDGRKAPPEQVTRRENPTLSKRTANANDRSGGLVDSKPVSGTVTSKPSSSTPSSPPIKPSGTADKSAMPTLAKRPIAPALTALASPELPAGPTADPTPAAPAPSNSVRTYEIRANDTLMSIAAQQLGSEKRWPEIQKINQDLDPKRMMPGVKIKLPGKLQQPTTDGNPRAKRVAA